MKGSEPPRIKVKPQNTNTMKNENKCFFSISLENGITITGNNPEEVKEFIMDFYTSAVDCWQTSTNEGYKYFAEKMDEYARQLLNAAHTIINNQKH